MEDARNVERGCGSEIMRGGTSPKDPRARTASPLRVRMLQRVLVAYNRLHLRINGPRSL